MKEYDGKQEVEVGRDDIKCPDGWLWKGDWQVDMGRAVDDQGQLVWRCTQGFVGLTHCSR